MRLSSHPLTGLDTCIVNDCDAIVTHVSMLEVSLVNKCSFVIKLQIHCVLRQAFLQHILDIFGSTLGRHNCFQITRRWWLLLHSYYFSILSLPISNIFIFIKKAICVYTRIRSLAKRVNKHQHQMHVGDNIFCHGTANAELSNHI